MKKYLAAAAAGFCLIAALSGCGGAAKTEAPAEKVLKVGTDATFPPFEYFLQQSSAYTGFEVELIQEVAKTAGYDRVEFQNASFDNLLSGLNEKQYDAVISCMSINADREKQADFTHPHLKSSYVVASQTAFEGDGTKEDLKDKKIAAKRGSVADQIAHTYTKDVVECDSAEAAVKMVIVGQADYVIADKYMAAYFEANGYGEDMKILPGIDLGVPSDLGIAVRKGDTELREKLDKAMHEYEGTTNFDQLKKEYFGNLM